MTEYSGVICIIYLLWVRCFGLKEITVGRVSRTRGVVLFGRWVKPVLTGVPSQVFWVWGGGSPGYGCVHEIQETAGGMRPAQTRCPRPWLSTCGWHEACKHSSWPLRYGSRTCQYTSYTYNISSIRWCSSGGGGYPWLGRHSLTMYCTRTYQVVQAELSNWIQPLTYKARIASLDYISLGKLTLTVLPLWVLQKKYKNF